jgi:uncharacterized protein with HEPN domain
MDNFKIDDKTVDTAVRNLEIIGEAVRQSPSAFMRFILHKDRHYFTKKENVIIPVFPARIKLTITLHFPSMDKFMCAR